MCLKDATDVEFLCSSLRLFRSFIVEGRKELKRWFVRALILEIFFAFLRLYRDVSLTVGGIREDKLRRQDQLKYSYFLLKTADIKIV